MLEIDIPSYENEILSLKKQIDTFRPLQKSQLANLQSWFKIGFTAESNALEGNTFTPSEVKVLIEDGITV